jgi:hypothetical protein
MFIYYMFLSARAVLRYKQVHKNTKVQLHGPVKKRDLNLYKSLCLFRIFNLTEAHASRNM